MPTAKFAACPVAVLVMCFFLMEGCRRQDAPQTIRVYGTVSYQGQPVSKGSIRFEPLEIAEDRPYRSAVAAIVDGRYVMSTFSEGDGVVPGKYKVLIHSSKKELVYYDNDRAIEWLIPVKYTQVDTTDLTVDIDESARGRVEHNFVLKD